MTVLTDEELTAQIRKTCTELAIPMPGEAAERLPDTGDREAGA